MREVMLDRTAVRFFLVAGAVVLAGLVLSAIVGATSASPGAADVTSAHVSASVTPLEAGQSAGDRR